MESDLYPRALARHGIGTDVPDDEDRAMVQRLTFTELTHGIFTEATREAFRGVIARLAERGCDTVALVCTEFPLLIAPGDSPLPTLESTTLIAEAAAAVALGDQPLPDWRGGRVGS
jgi:aspartate/glutamate racemase